MCITVCTSVLCTHGDAACALFFYLLACANCGKHAHRPVCAQVQVHDPTAQSDAIKALGNWPNTGDIRFEKVGAGTGTRTPVGLIAGRTGHAACSLPAGLWLVIYSYGWLVG